MQRRLTAPTLLFSATVFVGAALLFWVEPMLAKMLLPLLGGTPAVWNTCLLFFQAALLAGYGYVFFASRRLSLRQQIVVQFLLLLLAALTFPISISAATAQGVPREGNPALWLLKRLLLIVGLPFFALATLSPLLQRWLVATKRESQDPYFLYAASNAGSLCALVGYPLALEPLLTLYAQSRLWTVVYAALCLLVALCAALVWRATTATTQTQITEEEQTDQKLRQSLSKASSERETLTRWRRLRWVILALVPSSLMLGVTTYISTDIASLPLLWVVPLSLYLVTLIIAFARRRTVRQRRIELVTPGVALVFVLAYLSGATQPVWLLLLLHLLFFFVASLMCHGRLADDRPSTAHLEEFYLWVATGGALGGLFNALVAPLIFDRVVEYPLAVVAACALIPRRAPGADTLRQRRLDFTLAAALGGLSALLAFFAVRADWETTERLALVLGVPLLLAYLLRRRPVRFALALGAIMLGSAFHRSLSTETLRTERNFFGTLRITQDRGEDLRWLYHGTTVHGRQSTQLSKQCEPLSYYHRTGPLASVFAAYDARPASPQVAVVGLGTGATAAYARPGQRWTFYEINPAVLQLAQTPDYFTYLSYCTHGATVAFALGDARLRLADAPPAAYGLIILDAFSSDAIPLHLITQEALDLYLSKLAPGGILLFHISNRSLDLHPVVADLARSRSLACLASNDLTRHPDKEPSQWVAVARRPEDLQALAQDRRWHALSSDPARRIWTDDFSNIVGVLRWR